MKRKYKVLLALIIFYVLFYICAFLLEACIPEKLVTAYSFTAIPLVSIPFVYIILQLSQFLEEKSKWQYKPVRIFAYFLSCGMIISLAGGVILFLS